MQEGDDLLEHINKIKVLANRLIYLKVLMSNKDVVMALL